MGFHVVWSRCHWNTQKSNSRYNSPNLKSELSHDTADILIPAATGRVVTNLLLPITPVESSASTSEWIESDGDTELVLLNVEESEERRLKFGISNGADGETLRSVLQKAPIRKEAATSSEPSQRYSEVPSSE